MDNRNRVLYEQKLISEGMTSDEAARKWIEEYSKKKNLAEMEGKYRGTRGESDSKTIDVHKNQGTTRFRNPIKYDKSETYGAYVRVS